MVEIVSPSTVSIDRAVKAHVRRTGNPRLLAGGTSGHAEGRRRLLSRGRYVTRTTLVAGTLGRITRPFAVELDPADLTRRTP